MKKLREKNIGILTYVDLRTVRGKAFYWGSFAILVFSCIFTILPALWTIFASLKGPNEIYTSLVFFPKELSLSIAAKRVSDAWKMLKLGRSIVNTLYMSFVGWVIKILVCAFAGFVLSKLKPKGAKLVLAIVLWTMMMPGQMRIVPNYMSYMSFPFATKSDYGINLLNTYWPMWLGGAADAYSILLFKNAFDAVSVSLVEAARIDGAGNLKIFSRIVVPLSTPILIYISIGTLSAAWSGFFTPYLVIQDASKQLLPVKIFLMSSDAKIKQNTYLMGLIFASLPPFVIFAFFKKYIMGGINVGGVKG